MTTGEGVIGHTATLPEVTAAWQSPLQAPEGPAGRLRELMDKRNTEAISHEVSRKELWVPVGRAEFWL